MLEIKRCVVPLDENDVMELERIVTDADEKEALGFIRRAVYDRLLHAQQGKLKSHLDSANPVEGFLRNTQ